MAGCSEIDSRHVFAASAPTNPRHVPHHHQQHHQRIQVRTKVFVSRHNHSLNVTPETIVAQCKSSNILHSPYSNSQHGSVEPYRQTPTHVVLAECPFCPKPTGGKPDNMYKLYVATGSGTYYCHRCGAKGSWFDFCRRLAGGKDGKGGGERYDVVDARGRTSGGGGGGGAAQYRQYGQHQQPTHMRRGGYQEPHQQHGGNAATGGGNGGGACLPMPSQRLAAAYITSLLDVSSSPSSSDSTAASSSETTSANAALTYLTQTRGLTTKTLRKYGVGRGYYNFPSTDPNSSARYVREECVTFPWIMRASEVNEQEELREPPGRFDWVEEEDEEEEEEKIENESEVKSAAEAESSATRTSEGDAPLTKARGPWTTRRIKARSLNHKGHQRLDPPGGGWGLFGWHTVPADATSVVVTEGEYDAMAVYQATGRPAISLPNGCRSMPLDVLPLLERFDTIYLWMDNDGPGREGAEKFANKLGAKRCLIVSPKPEHVDAKGRSPKDANDALRMGLDLDDMLAKSEIMPHEQLLRFEDFREQVLHEIVNPDKYTGVGVSSLPLFTSIIKGFRRGEMTLITGPTGSGKTTFLGQLSLDFAEQGVNTLWGSFEIKNTRLVSKLLQQFSREPLPVGQPDKLEDLRALADRFEDLPLHFLRFHGSADIDAVIEAMKYAAYVHDVEHVILDNMQFMISRDQAGGSSYDKFDMQDIAIAKFRKFATENNVHVTLVCHPRKEDEGVRLGISSVFGSAKATQEADTVLILQNDGKRKYIEVKKNRYDGTLGMAPLHFQRGSGRYTEKPEFDFSGVKEQVKAQQQTQMAAPVQQQAKKMVARQITTKAAAPIKAAAAPKKRNIPTQEPSSPVDDANNAVKPPSSDDRWGEIMSN